MDPAATDAMLTLSLVPGLGPTLTRRCIEQFGNAASALDASAGSLAEIKGIGRQGARKMRAEMDRLSDGRALAREKKLIEEFGVELAIHGEPTYPPLLAQIPDPPPMLYIRGRIEPRDACALAVVGSRRCSLYGREQADRLSGLCAQSGLCIVSGGARGIDAAAHRAAIGVNGRTVAVLGSGLAEPYPAEHAELFNQIADGRGAVVSELPMSAPPIAENFPRRNRIISGLSLGVLVIEAASRSGASITARLAVEEHGREAMALPGRVDSPSSAGCHRMIREGWASLVTNAADVMHILGDQARLLGAALQEEAGAAPTATPAPGLTETQQRLVDALAQPMSFDQLTEHAGIAAHTLQAELTVLEIRGLVKHHAGRYALHHRG